jgi:hypothetical protein
LGSFTRRYLLDLSSDENRRGYQFAAFERTRETHLLTVEFTRWPHKLLPLHSMFQLMFVLGAKCTAMGKINSRLYVACCNVIAPHKQQAKIAHYQNFIYCT